MVIPTSVTALTVVSFEAIASIGFGLCSLAVTLAESVSVAVDEPLGMDESVGVTTMVRTAEALAARLPIGTVTTPLAWVGFAPGMVAELKVTFAGRVSLSVTPVASD